MSEPTNNQFFKGEAWACFFLRMWIGMRLMFAGLTKFLNKNDEGGWSFDQEKAGKVMGSITETMKANTAIPEVMLNQYATVLPWALLIVGAAVMLGICTRISLFLAGGLVLSLSFGLMLLPDDTAAVERGVEIIVVGLALMTVKHNTGAVDNLFKLAFSKDEEEEI
ncbi:MAG: DoxX family membrane protein [Verrucomicrobiales bacterium]|jgi:thiosulfate dehydrogenase (quinone) large subunit|nr:DoxX family membrane protein [Verrucomicrobiales bacterium]